MLDPVFVLRGHLGEVTSLACSPENADVIASGDSDGTVKVWDLPSRRAILSGSVSIFGILGLSWHPGTNQHLFVQTRDGAIRLWDVESAQAGGSFKTQGDPLLKIQTGSFSFCRMALPMAVSGDSETEGPSAAECHLIGACSDAPGVFDTWDTRTGQKAVTCGGKSSKAMGLVMSLRLLLNPAQTPSYLTPVAGYESGHVATWDLRSPGDPLSEARLHTEPVTCLDVSGRGDRAVCGSTADSLSFFRLNHNIQESHNTTLPKPGSADVAVRQDGRICALGCRDGRVGVFNFRTGQLLALLRQHSAEVSGVVFTRHQLLCAASRDGTLSAWDVYPSRKKDGE